VPDRERVRRGQPPVKAAALLGTQLSGRFEGRALAVREIHGVLLVVNGPSRPGTAATQCGKTKLKNPQAAVPAAGTGTPAR